MLQFLAQRLEDFLPRVRAVVVHQLLQRVSLCSFEEGPELVFGDEVLGFRNIGLLQHGILVLADEVIRDVLLKRQLRGFFSFRHERFPFSTFVFTGTSSSSSRTVAPQAGQRKQPSASSSKRNPVSSLSESGREVMR